MVIPASRAVELLRDEARDADEPLRVYWHEMTEASRQDFASELLNLRGGLPIVPIVLRGALFNNPNALLSDLATLIDDNRNAFVGVPGTRSGCLCVMLLARTRLQTPQVSSPVMLPEWFPVQAGREIHVRLRVFADSVEVALLNAKEARVERLAELLFGFEEVLAERLEVTYARCSRELDRLFGELKAVPEVEKMPPKELLSRFRNHLHTVSEPRAYRPSVRTAGSLVALLIRLVMKSSPDRIASVGAALAKALCIGDGVEMRPPMLSVLLRPSARGMPGAAAGHAMLLAVYGAYQFITGAAHAGEYPAFAIGLLHSTSRDLCRALQDGAEIIRGLEQPRC